MSSTPRFHPSIADVVTLSAALDREQRQKQDSIKDRDRLIGEHLPRATTRAETAMRWLDSVSDEDTQLRSIRNNVAQTTHWVGALIAMIGLLFGWIAALGVFFFDGSSRVNAIGVLAVFVVIPAFLILPFIAAALPPRLLSWLPGASALAALARGLSPGRLSFLILRFFPADIRDSLKQLSGRAGANRQLSAGLRKWTLLHWSQSFALGFHVAALTSALFLVVFTDLAFGWSTTLTSGDPDEDARIVHSIVSGIAIPWSWILPDALPSLDLVTDSRYFRAATARLTVDEAARLGGWWMFIVTTMLIYGLVPRFTTFYVARNRLDAAARHAFLSSPGLTSVLNRIRQAHVRTASDAPGARRTEKPGKTVGDAAPTSHETMGAVINWSSVPANAIAMEACFGGIPTHAAGASVSVDEDRILVDKLAACLPPNLLLAILVKAWEPPLMEFIDFLHDLRRSLGKDRSIVVLPVGIGTESRLEPADEHHTRIWRRKITEVGDPWLRVGLVGEVSAR